MPHLSNFLPGILDRMSSLLTLLFVSGSFGGGLLFGAALARSRASRRKVDRFRFLCLSRLETIRHRLEQGALSSARKELDTLRGELS